MTRARGSPREPTSTSSARAWARKPAGSCWSTESSSPAGPKASAERYGTRSTHSRRLLSAKRGCLAAWSIAPVPEASSDCQARFPM